MSIAALGYVRLQMRDPHAWGRFAEDVLGFAAAQGADGGVRLRMDGAPFRYLVERGSADRFAAAGWECPDEAAFGALVEALRSADALKGHGGNDEERSREVAGVAFGEDPSGNVFEVYHGRADSERAFVSPVPGLSFVTDPMGLGHVVLPAPEIDATSAFYRDVLGFGLSDRLTLPAQERGWSDQRLEFLHADNPRHHSLGLYNQMAPSGVAHIMAEVDSLDSVGLCLDRAKAANAPIVATLGRHWNDHMVSFYMLAPGGIPIEYGYGGRRHDWDGYEPTAGAIADLWGHEYAFPEPA